MMVVLLIYNPSTEDWGQNDQGHHGYRDQDQLLLQVVSETTTPHNRGYPELYGDFQDSETI